MLVERVEDASVRASAFHLHQDTLVEALLEDVERPHGGGRRGRASLLTVAAGGRRGTAEAVRAQVIPAPRDGRTAK